MAKISPEEHLKLAATDLFFQAYGAKVYRSHAPTVMQWLSLGAALAENGVGLPNDWADVLKSGTVLAGKGAK